MWTWEDYVAVAIIMTLIILAVGVVVISYLEKVEKNKRRWK